MSDKINRREILIERIINAKEFSWNEDLNYRDYILAIWRTFLNEKETKQDAKIVLKLIGEEAALSLIAKKIKLQ